MAKPGTGDASLFDPGCAARRIVLPQGLMGRVLCSRWGGEVGNDGSPPAKLEVSAAQSCRGHVK